MGKGSEGIAASSGDGEDNGPGSCKAHHVSISPEEDRGVSAGTVGEVESRNEGCLEPVIMPDWAVPDYLSGCGKAVASSK
jgi:hypothetical protein